MTLPNDSEQSPLDSWRATLSNRWDILGPFPIHAREQHLLSPSFPINIQEPIDYSRTWPSSYADRGVVSWSNTMSTGDGQIEVSFPDIRWKSLCATEGWAAYQHHAILHGTLTIFPPANGMDQQGEGTRLRLLVQLLQGSFFTILPGAASDIEATPKWHYGNVYAMERALPQAVDLPSPPSLTTPTEYDIFISGDYEIRLFGDPIAYNSQYPIQSLQISVKVEKLVEQVVHEPTQDVLCDFVDGYAFGDALGIGLRSVDGWWIVNRVALIDASVSQDLTVHLKQETRIAPSQTGIVPIVIHQTRKFHGEEFKLGIDLKHLSRRTAVKIIVRTRINQLAPLESQDRDAHYSVKASYFYSEAMPTNFIAIPPLKKNIGEVTKAPVLCLHGAGVDVIETPWWPDVLPRLDHSWLIIPTGRTSWGLDWHGPSAKDAWDSLGALAHIVKRTSSWGYWKLPDDPSVVILGHSNGGQGAWYLASRYPDRILAVIPMAAYIKSQAYVPWTQSRSAHYIDPALRSILHTALTPDDNDLFMSNIAHIPILAIHGGLDTNVPVWHSREYVSLLKTLDPATNATFREDPGQPHWYPSAILDPGTLDFLHSAVDFRRPAKAPKDFTLTVATPSESGSLFGFQVLRLTVPGRLGRVKVRFDEQGDVHISTTNIDVFEADLSKFLPTDPVPLYVDKTTHVLSGVCIIKKEDGTWKFDDRPSDSPPSQPSGRAQLILTTHAPLTIVIPDENSSCELSIALRIAHNLHVYHRLDSVIIGSTAALRTMEEGLIHGNVVSIGGPLTPFTRRLIESSPTPFTIREDGLSLNTHHLSQAAEGVLSLLPHPHEPSATVLMVAGEGAGLERAFRQVPLRTGLPTPDWLVMSEEADCTGEGGIRGAGVWGRDWTWNECSSWLY